MSFGTLYLIPVPLGPNSPEQVLPPPVLERVRLLERFVAENAKSARAFLKSAGVTRPLRDIPIAELNEHSTPEQVPPLLEPLLQGQDVGLVSEAGCPAVADPGAALVRLAQQRGVPVVPLVGPSSLLLALMGSGLSGQHFAFHGYLPAKEEERGQKLKALEKESRHQQSTQIFIETPYRNRAMFESLLKACQGNTLLCLATDVTLPSESIRTQAVSAWKALPLPPDLEKKPTVFLFLAQ